MPPQGLARGYNGRMNADHENDDRIPSILPDWIYTADLAIFEARQAVKRRNASYFRDVVGINAPRSENAEILKMIRAARGTAKAAQAVEHELVIEARYRGIPLKKIGRALGMREPGVHNYLTRHALTPERQLEITRELEAWAALNWFWSRDGDTDEPGETFYLDGVDQLLRAVHEYDQAMRLRSRGGSMGDGGQKIQSAGSFLQRAIESFTEPQVPRVIEKHAPKVHFDEGVGSGVIPGTATAYIRHGIFEAVLAKIAFNDILKGPAQRRPGSTPTGDMTLTGIYMVSALVSLSRPEAMFVSNEMIEFLRRENPELLASTNLSLDQIQGLMDRRFRSNDLDDSDNDDDDPDDPDDDPDDLDDFDYGPYPGK